MRNRIINNKYQNSTFKLSNFPLIRLAILFIIHYSLFTNLSAQTTANKAFKKEKTSAGNEARMAKEEYIQKYKDDAIKDMLRTKVPASITLGQAMLESDNGNSKLAKNANNHFGIKCHNGWTGATYNMDDDAKNECFRKYKTVLDSYDDHSDFLRNRTHYAFLFELKSTDYKGWAEGLKKAGYATSPTYAKDLIKIIEDNKLYEMDKLLKMPEKEAEVAEKENPKKIEPPAIPAKTSSNPPKTPAITDKSSNVPIKKNEPISSKGAPVLLNNEVKYIVASKGETFYKIAKENNVNVGELYTYNDLGKDAILSPGQMVYLQPKRNSACVQYHIVKAGETMYSISQEFGIKLKMLYKKNLMNLGTEPVVGQRLWLKANKKEGEK
jgi:LysM repeat protein